MMLKELTKSRSPQFHKETMLKLTVTGLLLWVFWAPLAPIRNITATVLHTTADAIYSQN